VLGCALGSAGRGGGIPLSILTTAAADPSGGLMVVVGYLLIWPGIATIGVLLGTVLSGAASSLLPAMIVFAVGAGGVFAWLRRPADFSFTGVPKEED
jgi:hypothetical protein